MQTPVVPGAPTGVTALAGNKSAVVSFAAPASDGGSSIYSYTVTASPGGATASSTGSPVTLTGLTNGTSYTFTVTATNNVGTGPASAPSKPVVPGPPATVPGALTGVSAAAGNGSAAVSFAAPASDGGSAITAYTVTATDATNSARGGQTASGAASPITVSGLTNGDSYTFTVTATNNVGTGPASAPSSPVVPATVPAAPTAVKAVSKPTTAKTGSLSVTFRLGANDGSAITSQKATCKSSNGGVSGTGAHSGASAAAITVGSLTTGKTYSCTVTATNARGVSSPSAKSAAVIVGSPTAPTKVKASRAAAGKLKVRFTSSASNGSAITGFTARCTSSNGGVTKAKSGAASPLTVTGLTAGKLYTCAVTATNSRGTGLASTASKAVTA